MCEPKTDEPITTYTTIEVADPDGFRALLTAINCAGFAERLLKSALQNRDTAAEDGMARSYLEEARDILRSATINADNALRKLPKPKTEPSDEPPGDPNQADKDWLAQKENRP